MNGLHLGERLAVRSTGPTALPAEFTWRGKRYVVRRLERRPNAARPGRYELVTMDGLRCIVIQDRERNAWHLERMLSGRRGGLGG